MVHNGRGGDVEHRTSDDVEPSHARSVKQQRQLTDRRRVTHGRRQGGGRGIS